MRRILSLFFIIAFPLALFSQQLATYNFYHYNLDLINPAATAYQECKQFVVADRHQWTGIEGAPSIQTLGVQLPKPVHKYRKYGLGANLVRDVNGATQNLGGELLYAYHLTLRALNPTHVSFGLSAKFGQHTFDERDFTDAVFDPAVTRSLNVEWYYNFASGILMYGENFHAGLGVYNLFPGNINYYTDYGNEPYFLTFIGGYQFTPRGSNLVLTPSVYAAKGNSFYQADLNLNLLFPNNLKAGLCLRKYQGDNFYRSGQNLLLLIGYQFEKWGINYAYDVGINAMQLHHFGSHQLAVSYTLCRDKYACPVY